MHPFSFPSDSKSPRPRRNWPRLTACGLGLIALAGLAMMATACGTPRASLGYTIPGTPISLGMSVPLDRNGNVILNQNGRDPNKTTYRQVRIESDPPGAEIYLDGDLAGSTPSDVAVPFDKGWFGAKGSTMILLKKPGYLPQGFRVFPSGDGVSLTEGGARQATIQRTMGQNGTAQSGGGQNLFGSGGYSSR